jgi:hypothetical protein
MGHRSDPDILEIGIAMSDKKIASNSDGAVDYVASVFHGPWSGRHRSPLISTEAVDNWQQQEDRGFNTEMELTPGEPNGYDHKERA